MRVIINGIDSDDFDKIRPILDDISKADYRTCGYRFLDDSYFFARITKTGISITKDTDAVKTKGIDET